MAKGIFDVDGVLARFNPAFLRLLNDVNGTTIQAPAPDESWIRDWHWPEKQLGFTSEQVGRAWNAVRQDPFFWLTLRSFETTEDDLAALLEWERQGNEVYFVTARTPPAARGVTARWLAWHGFEHPSVIVSEEKGKVASVLEADILIDDRPENLDDVLVDSARTWPFVMDRPWNADYVYATRVSSVREMLQRFAVRRERPAA